MTEVDFSGVSAAPAPAAGSNLALAQAALVELGYNQAEIAAALKGIPAEELSTEEIVRRCLRAMVMR